MSEPVIRVGIIDHPDPYPYGDPLTYRLGADWLEPCETVEDWGCGRGYLRYFIAGARYRGIDMGVDSVPQANPFATIQANLTMYRSTTAGIFMRHVLEHNYDWWRILDNACQSFTKRMFLAVFTPLADEAGPEAVTIALHGPPEYPCYDPPVPNLSFRRSAIERRLGDIAQVTYEYRETGTQYGQEHLWYLAR